MYFTVKDYGNYEFEEKKSIFIGNVKRVENEAMARDFIDEIKYKYKESRHNVYAYIIGEKMNIQRYSDDGEPQGTGGVPILEVIKKNKLTDCVVVVTRYFGGILLGTGGLTRAYSKAAAEGIKSAGIVEKVKGKLIHIIIDYDLIGKVQYLCNKNKWFIENIKYTDKVTIDIYSDLQLIEVIKNNIIELTSNKVNFIEEKEEYFFKGENRLFKIK